jgi:hypothetical protein
MPSVNLLHFLKTDQHSGLSLKPPKNSGKSLK